MICKGSCHCGQVAFEVVGDLTQVTDCNCSICSRKGALYWPVPRDNLRLLTPEKNLSSYTFNKHLIKHRFCSQCGIHLFAERADPSGNRTAVVNVRCLEGVDFSSLPVKHFDGRSL
jgi:hypothetical protein